MNGYYSMGQMFFPGFGILIQLLLFVAFLIVIYWVIKSGNITRQSPEDILKSRLAKGEITKKEYIELKKELQK